MAIIKAFAYEAKEAYAPFERINFEIDTEKIGADEVVVALEFSGLCHSDLHAWTDWNIPGTFPLVPGHEGAGKILCVGSNVKTHEIGERVVIGWLADSCCECSYCRVGDDNLCYKSQPTIIGRKGTFASHCVVHKNFAYQVPQEMSMEEAGIFACAGGTVAAPIFKHKEHAKTAAVIGLGGLGHLAVQYLRKLGMETAVLTRGHSKDEFAKKLGAHYVVDMSNDEEVAKYTHHFDLVINTAPSVLDWAKYIGMTARNGNWVIVGLPTGADGEGITSMEVPIAEIIFNQLGVNGSIVAGSRDLSECLRFAATNSIHPMFDVRPLSSINDTMKDLEEGKPRFRYVFNIHE